MPGVGVGPRVTVAAEKKLVRGENQRYNRFSSPRCWDAKQNTVPQFAEFTQKLLQQGYGICSPAPWVHVEGKEHLKVNRFKLFHQLSNALTLSFYPKNQICAPFFFFFAPQIEPGEFRTSPRFETVRAVPVTSRCLCQEMNGGSFSGRRLEITPPP